MSVNGIVHYAIAHNANNVMFNQWVASTRNRWVQWAASMPQEMLPGMEEAPF
jgi:hypothetical protein